MFAACGCNCVHVKCFQLFYKIFCQSVQNICKIIAAEKKTFNVLKCSLRSQYGNNLFRSISVFKTSYNSSSCFMQEKKIKVMHFFGSFGKCLAKFRPHFFPALQFYSDPFELKGRILCQLATLMKLDKYLLQPCLKL
jgi:hypothetical protein